MTVRLAELAIGVVMVEGERTDTRLRRERVVLVLESGARSYLLLDVFFVVGDETDQQTYRQAKDLAMEYDVGAILTRGKVDEKWLLETADEVRMRIINIT